MSSRVVQKGDLILITGGTGWVGSHIVDKALEHGLRVRLAVRNEQKAQQLIKGLKAKYGERAHLETVTVKDFDSESAYDEAVKGVQGIIHAASTVTFSEKWEDVVPPTIRGYSALLKAAHAQGDSIKRVVLTSSSIAVARGSTEPDAAPYHITTETWNDADVELAKKSPNPLLVYAASKVLSERFAWNFVNEHKPAFILNTVNPSLCAGAKAPGSEYLSTALWLRKAVLEADQNVVDTFSSSYLVDTDDVGLLHVLAATREDIVNERILAFSEVYTWDKIIDIAQKYAPEKVNTVKKSEKTSLKSNVVANLSRTQEILKEYGGLKTLEESVRLNLQD
ncbi:NAD(P)-binding protein [Meira miltonrushii]|uniref:NAD(P)-binding protein n=1 Tax=Meira miltonrushii TaxID=1280837 RepID=A0A316VI20_9BASI|nr:NAD(P)-binding protein [Meira miltonrushii]PWN37186.1 NAD(P)-binding protein [Meira miltonrushii]